MNQQADIAQAPAEKPKVAKRSPESYAKAPGRPPDKVIEDRVGEAMAILASRPSVSRFQLHKLLKPRWNCHWRTIDRMVAHARANLMERLNRSREEFRCDVLAAYEKELANEKPGIRLAALQGIRDLLGLDAPRRQELSGPGGGPIGILDHQDIIIVWPHETFGGAEHEPATIQRSGDTPAVALLTAGSPSAPS
jgi:hypothetical protein